jgi:hypothetical protein
MNAKDTLDKVKTLLGLEVQLEERLLENGTRFEADAFESGREVFIISEDDERIAVPAGEYLLDDGMILIVEEDGVIAEIKEEVDVEEEVEVSEEEELSTESEEQELAEFDPSRYVSVEDYKGMEERILNLEDAISKLKGEVKAEDLSTDKVENTEVELSEEVKPLKHNPEAKGEVEMHLYSQNKPMSTQDRVFAKLFKN